MKLFYSTPLFNGLQISRFDPFCLEMIRSDLATITISLQFVPLLIRRYKRCDLCLTPALLRDF